MSNRNATVNLLLDPRCSHRYFILLNLLSDTHAFRTGKNTRNLWNLQIGTTKQFDVFDMFTYCFQLIKAMDLNLFFIIWLLIIALIIALRLLSKIEFNYANWTQELFVYGKEKRLHDLETKEQVRSTVVRLLVNLQVPKR